MKFDKQFHSKIYESSKIYTIRDRNRHGEVFSIDDIDFVVHCIDSFMAIELEKRLQSKFYDPIKFGFDTHEEMNHYYIGWFHNNDFPAWKRLALHQILYLGHNK